MAYDPPRQLGRVKEKDWKRLKRAAKKEQKTFSAWARDILLERANRVIKQG